MKPRKKHGKPGSRTRKKALTAARKAKATRRQREGKEVVTPKRKLRIVFQCMRGVATSKQFQREFIELLTKEGLLPLFTLKSIGMMDYSFKTLEKRTPADQLHKRLNEEQRKKRAWSKAMKKADIIVTIAPEYFYKRFGFNFPENKKIFNYGDYFQSKGELTGRQMLFEDLMSYIKKSYKLVPPRKKKKPE
jgi:hypothetical protein